MIEGDSTSKKALTFVVVVIFSLSMVNAVVVGSARGFSLIGPIDPIEPPSDNNPPPVFDRWKNVPSEGERITSSSFTVKVSFEHAGRIEFKLDKGSWLRADGKISEDYDGDGTEETHGYRNYQLGFGEHTIEARSTNFEGESDTSSTINFERVDSDGLSYSEELDKTRSYSFSKTSYQMNDPQKPSTPQNIDMIYCSDHSIKFEWDRVRRAKNYTIYEGGDTIKKGHTSTTFEHDGLDPNTEYTYQVKAVNYEGESSRSNEKSMTTSEKDDGGGGDNSPLGLEVMSVGENYVKLTWDALSGFGSIEIYRKSESQSNFNKIDEISIDKTLYADYSVDPMTWYHYKIKKVPQYGEDQYSNIVSAFTDSSGTNPMMLQTTEIGPASKATYSFENLKYEAYLKNVRVKGIKIKCEKQVDSLDIYATLRTKNSNAHASHFERLTNDYENIPIGFTPSDRFLNPKGYHDWVLEIDVQNKRGIGFKIKGSPKLEITTCLSPYNNSDKDGDGWIDSEFNKRTKLKLTRVERVETGIDSSDYAHLVVDDVRRYPGYQGDWKLKNDGDVVKPNTVIDKRVVTRNNKEFLTELRFGLNNWQGRVFNWKWQPGDKVTHEYKLADKVRYELTFISFYEYFADPSTKKDDADGDGLTDAEEYRMSNNPDDLSVDGRAMPGKKDIFVEVDWMEGHEMKDGAKWRVGTRFLNNPAGEEIWLHLDDGLMGGGEEITEKDKTAFYLKEGDNEDFWDYKWGNGWKKKNNGDIIPGTDPHFSLNRWGKFHYCLFANDADNNDSSVLNPTGPHMGVSRDDEFIIGDNNWHKEVPDIIDEIFELPASAVLCPKEDSSTVQAAIFMHELGHNFDLKYTGGWQVGSSDEGYDPDGPVICMNYYYILSEVKYTNSGWDEVQTNMDIYEGGR